MTRINLEDQTYFVTGTTHRRRELFSDTELARIVVDQWQHYQKPHDFDLQAYAVMPDHYHVLLQINGDHNLSRILYAVHSYSSKLINERLDGEDREKIWQGDAFDEVIRSEDMYYQKLAYILFNPWRADLVENPYCKYEFCNLGEWKEEEGEEFLEDLYSKYGRWAE
ncbi:transposase [Candidatus Bipolaricaulota bacterium]|nr:transposase [Candidatus Bipolaricaulota bacterium]